MKKTVLLLATMLIVGIISAQKPFEEKTAKVFDKLVVDIGAIPFSTSNLQQTQVSAYNLALGYKFSKRFDFRINTDLYNLFDANETNSYERLFGLSLGTNYLLLAGQNNSLLNKADIHLVGKFGAGISPENMEQESLFYDVSMRTYFGKSYLGIGSNNQLFGSSIKPNLSTLYISFGIDF